MSICSVLAITYLLGFISLVVGWALLRRGSRSVRMIDGVCSRFADVNLHSVCDARKNVDLIRRARDLSRSRDNYLTDRPWKSANRTIGEIDCFDSRSPWRTLHSDPRLRQRRQIN